MRFIPLLFLLGVAGLFSLRSLFVSLVQACHHLVGDVVSLVGVEDIVAGLAEDESVLLVLVIYGEEVLDAVAQCVVVSFSLCLALRRRSSTTNHLFYFK
mgnify:CR=1 FL=1